MNDKEKEAVKKIEKVLYMFPESKELKLLLNLIENQQKEIENLRSDLFESEFFDINKKWQSKIKAAIEKYEEKFKAENGKKTINYHLYRIIIDEVLKPLLKED